MNWFPGNAARCIRFLSIVMLSSAAHALELCGTLPDEIFDNGFGAGPSISVDNETLLSTPTDVGTLPDEHSSYLPPTTIDGPFLFFEAAKYNNVLGAVVMQTDSNFQSLMLASGYATPVLSSPKPFGQCATVGDPGGLDSEFDENYAAPGSVLQDPTLPDGNLMMIYEGENHCRVDPSDGTVYNVQPYYATAGFARSNDNGVTWPAPGLTPGPFRYPISAVPRTSQPTILPAPPQSATRSRAATSRARACMSSTRIIPRRPKPTARSASRSHACNWGFRSPLLPEISGHERRRQFLVARHGRRRHQRHPVHADRRHANDPDLYRNTIPARPELQPVPRPLPDDDGVRSVEYCRTTRLVLLHCHQPRCRRLDDAAADRELAIHDDDAVQRPARHKSEHILQRLVSVVLFAEPGDGPHRQERPRVLPRRLQSRSGSHVQVTNVYGDGGSGVGAFDRRLRWRHIRVRPLWPGLTAMLHASHCADIVYIEFCVYNVRTVLSDVS